MARVALTDDNGALYGAPATWLGGQYATHRGSLDLARLSVTSALAIPANAATHRVEYEDAETFAEDWSDAAAWSAGAGVAAGGYFVGSSGSQAGHVHALAVPSGGRLRLSSSLVVPSSTPSNTGRHAFVGLSQGTTVSGIATYGIGVDPATNRPMVWRGSSIGGSGVSFLSTDVLAAGTYQVLVNVDETTVSLSLVNSSHSVEYRANLPRATMGAIGSLVIFQNDDRAANGVKVGALAAKRASATITPRTMGAAKPETFSYSTSWADLAGWTGTNAQVSGGRMYGIGTSSANLGRPLPTTNLSDFTLNTDLATPAPGGSALFLVGVGATDTAGDMIAIGFNNNNDLIGWRGVNMGGSGSTTLATGQASATYQVNIRAINGTMTFTVRTQDGATVVGSFSVALSSIPSNKQPTRLLLWTSDGRGLSGISAGTYTVDQVIPAVPQYLEGGADSVIWTNHMVSSTSNARIALPKRYDSRRPAPVIVYAHGTNRLGGAPFDDSPSRSYFQGLLDAGYIVASSDGGGNAWGSPAAVSDYEALIRYVQTHYAVTGFLLLSQSMGGPALLNVIRSRNVGGIVAWYGIAPVVDLEVAYNASTAYASQMNTAYGIAGDGSNFAEKIGYSNPADAAPEEFRGLPMRVITYADDDAIHPDSHGSPLLAKVAGYAPEASYREFTGTAHIGSLAFDVADTLGFFQKYLPAPR